MKKEERLEVAGLLRKAYPLAASLLEIINKISRYSFSDLVESEETFMTGGGCGLNDCANCARDCEYSSNKIGLGVFLNEQTLLGGDYEFEFKDHLILFNEGCLAAANELEAGPPPPKLPKRRPSKGILLNVST